MNKKETKFKETKIGEIPEDWKVKEIRELGEIVTGKTPKTEDKENFGDKYQFITPRDMKGQRYILKTERYLSEKGKNSVKNCLVPENSICVSCIGSDMGKINMTKEESITNQQINSIVPKISADFIYYSVLNISPNIKNLGKQSTAIPILNKSQFSKIEIAVPSERIEMEKIASILSSLDSKIELNQAMNKTIESIGQAIFKQWFVDFEFPNEKGKPYKSSGGEMVESELGEIPKGWGVSTLREFITVERGLSYKGSGLTEDGLPMINLANFAPNHGLIHSATKPYSGEYKERNLVKAGDIVIANTDITQKRDVLGSPAIVPNLESEKILFTHHVYAVRNKSWIPNYFIYYLLQLKQYEDRTRGFATGTTVLFLPDDAILDFQFVLSNKELVEKFVSIIKIFQDRLNLNTSEYITLTMLRDSLLPKLMSGKIRVPAEVIKK